MSSAQFSHVIHYCSCNKTYIPFQTPMDGNIIDHGSIITHNYKGICLGCKIHMFGSNMQGSAVTLHGPKCEWTVLATQSIMLAHLATLQILY